MHTFESLQADLRRLGLRPEETVLLHSSMKRIGEVAGGADRVLDALLDYFRPGLLVLPTLTYRTVNAEQPIFHELETPAMVGLLPNLFRLRPGVARSLHPTHSLAAAGEGAAEFVAGHENFDSPCAPASPWGRLRDRRAKILFIGTGIGCNTFFHGVEELAGVPGMLTETRQALCVVARDGRKIELPSRRHVGSHSNYYAKTEAALARGGALARGRFGDADCHLLDAARAAELVLALLARDPLYFTHDRL